MKTLIVFLFAVFFINTGQAQEVTQLGETKVEFTPYTLIQTSNLDTYNVVVKESYVGLFSKNALKFVKENFNASDLIKSINNPDYDTYLVSFKSTKGYLEATYNQDGEMRYSYQSFKDIVLPVDIRNNLFTNYEGWTMVKNKYVASGKGDTLDKELYRIKLKKDNMSQNIKIIPSRIGSDRVVSN